MDLEVIALLDPCLEEAVELIERGDAQGAHLGLELLDDGAVEALDRAAALALVRLRVDELDGEVVEREGEVVGAVGRAPVDVDAVGPAALEERLLERVFEGGDVFAEVPLRVDDQLRVVVDEDAHVDLSEALRDRIEEQPRVVVVADPELIGPIEHHLDEALDAEGLDPAARPAGLAQMMIEGGAVELPLRHEALLHENVDDGLRRARRDLAPTLDRRGEHLGRDRPRAPAVGAAPGHETLEPAPLVGAPPRPQGPGREGPLAAARKAERPQGELTDAHRQLADGQGLVVQVRDDGVAKERGRTAALVDVVGAHAPRSTREGRGPIFQGRGETRPGEQRDLPQRPEPRHEPEPERARIIGGCTCARAKSASATRS